jgi:hypothetical protein
LNGIAKSSGEIPQSILDDPTKRKFNVFLGGSNFASSLIL